jgi:hypothetical protein
MTSSKSLSLAQEIRSALVQRGIASVGSVGIDATDSNVPYILVGAGTAASQSALIKIREVAPLGYNITGGAATGYAQHVIQLVLESSTLGVTVPLLTEVNKYPILGELLSRGARLELYTTANATAITTLVGAVLPSANLRVTFDPSAQYRLMAQS